MCYVCVFLSLSLSLSIALSESSVVFANAARRDAGFFNVFLLRSYFLWVVWVGGWGDVNVPWKRYVTYAGVGVGGVG